MPAHHVPNHHRGCHDRVRRRILPQDIRTESNGWQNRNTFGRRFLRGQEWHTHELNLIGYYKCYSDGSGCSIQQHQATLEGRARARLHVLHEVHGPLVLLRDGHLHLDDDLTDHDLLLYLCDERYEVATYRQCGEGTTQCHLHANDELHPLFIVCDQRFEGLPHLLAGVHTRLPGGSVEV